MAKAKTAQIRVVRWRLNGKDSVMVVRTRKDQRALEILKELVQRFPSEGTEFISGGENVLSQN